MQRGAAVPFARLSLIVVLALGLCIALNVAAEPQIPQRTQSTLTAANVLTVVDAQTHRPIAAATVTLGARAWQTDAQGRFSVPAGAARVGVRAPGYRRQTIASVDALLAGGAPGRRSIALQPFVSKGLYLTVYGIGSRTLRDGALQAIEHSHLNTIVIDMKGDSGLVPYPSAVPAVRAVGALKVRTVKDLPALLVDLKARGPYTIARLVVFKDTLYAGAHPQWAIRTAGGAVWKDRESMAWIDPTQADAWQYTLDIAAEVAAAGFDEIQFDYIRFPDTVGLRFARPLNQAVRVAAIGGFLRAARARLVPYNVFISADVFGYACWNNNDTTIGQHLESLAPLVDYLSPMLYPSSFQFGIPGVRQPFADPHAIVARSLQRAAQRTAATSVRYRPWLQDFRDYAFDGRVMTRELLQAQIRAAEGNSASVGWMLWNPRNRYSADAIHAEDPSSGP